MLFVLCLVSLLNRSVLSCGYTRLDNDYHPLDVCFFSFDNDLSYYHTCYGSQVYDLVYSSLNCVGTPTQNETSTTDESWCNIPGACDYVEFVVHDPNAGETINCNDISTTTHPFINNAKIINKCLYQPSYDLYRLGTCTNTVYTSSYFTDQYCQNELDASYRYQIRDECTNAAPEYVQINKCTAPFNRIDNDCGYVQYNKNANIIPLNQCYVGESSWLYLCIDNDPYVYVWHSTTCDESVAPDQNISIVPFSFSCSSNPCNYFDVKVYEDADCIGFTSMTSFVSYSMVTDHCFNWFGSDHILRSSLFSCDESIRSATEIMYNGGGCNPSFGIYNTINWSEGCSINDNTNISYKIECNSFISSTILYTTTAPATTTATIAATSTTTEPTDSPITTAQYDRVVYVTANGSDFDGCGYTETDGCGTLHYASRQSLNFNSVEIIVQGQNIKSIQEAIAQGALNPCITDQLFHIEGTSSNTIITFDPRYIDSMEDWYNVKACEVSPPQDEEQHHFIYVFQTSSPTTLTLNNLIIDSYVFQGLVNQMYYIMKPRNVFVCNSCKFSNITIHSSHHTVNSDSALIVGRDMSFNNCLFENIIYVASSGVGLEDYYQYDFSFIRMDAWDTDSVYSRVFNFAMMHSAIHAVFMLNTFVSLYPSKQVIFNDDNITYDQRNTVIQDNIFDDIAVVDAIFYHQPNAVSTVDISNSNFMNLILGSILHSTDDSSIINIDNVSISTSQTIQQYLNGREQIGRTTDNDLYSLLIFENEFDVVTINNVNIKYYYADDLSNHCVITEDGLQTFDWYIMDLTGISDGEWWYLVYYCNVPIQFIDSTSTVTIANVTVRNDITDVMFEAYRDSIISAIHTSFSNPLTTIYLDFMYNERDSNNNDISDIAFIYSTGAMAITSFKVYGAAAHYTLIHNSEGNLYIDDMVAIPETYCTNNTVTCKYNSDALQISHWITFGTATQTSNGCASEFRFSNSFVYGQKGVAIDINIGYAYLHNIIMQMAVVGISVSSSTTEFQLSSSVIKDIGPHYASATSYLNAGAPQMVPFYFDAKSTIIKDNLFSFVNPYQFDMFDPEYFSSDSNRQQITNDDEITAISLINNIFEINDENVLVPYPFPHSLSQIVSEISGSGSNTDEEQYFYIDGMMVIRDNVDIISMNNVFRIKEDNLYVDRSILIEEGIPWIYIADSNGSICMSGNEFTDFAILLEKGSITSCIKPDLINYFTASDCKSYGTFGKTDIASYDDNQGRPNIFNVQSSSDTLRIINIKEDAFIALYNNVINIYELQNTINIITMENGNYLFVDTVIEASYNTYWYISIEDTCDVHCYSTFNETAHLIQTLHATCDSNNTDGIIVNSINDIYKADTLSHWTPYLIDIYPDPNGRYFPGDRLTLGYDIYDVFDNKIDTINQNITITLQSDNEAELFAHFQLVIDADGTCAACDSGLLFIAVTLDDHIGKNYSLSAVVKNDQLFVADSIDITIIQCPSGYGSYGYGSCALCNKGYFSLLPTENECLDCNQDTTDGIQCIGGNHIIIDETYWISVDAYSDKHILSGKCPPSYCCQLSSGCDFILNDESLCAKYRDVNVFLCGKCLNGYSELFGTSACAKCSNTYWYRIFIPIIFGLLVSFYIILSVSATLNSNPTKSSFKCDCLTKDTQSKNTDKAMSKSEFMDSLEIMLIKCILYYYQTLSNLLLSTNGVPNALIGFVGLFNFDVFSKISSGNSDDGYCLFSNLNAISKIVIQLTTTLCIILFVFTSYILLSLSINILKPLKRRPHYGRAFLKVSFLCVGQILSVLFQLLACRNVGNINVHYFFGSHQCYGFVWIVAAICLMFIILFFIILFIIIRKKMKAEQPSYSPRSLKTKAMYHSAIWCYKKEYWYWELILFVRRLLLAFVLIVFDSNDLRMYTALILMIYLSIHLQCAPFKYNDANRFEGYLIGATVLLIAIDANYRDDSVNEYGNVLISLLILFPIFWFIYFILSRCANLTKDDDANKNIVVEIECGNLSGNIKSLSATPYTPSPMPIEDKDEEKAQETNQIDHLDIDDNDEDEALQN